MTLGSVTVGFKRPAARSSGSSDASVSAEFKKTGAGATDLNALKDSVKTGVTEKVTDAVKSGDGAIIPKTSAPKVQTTGVIKEPTKTAAQCGRIDNDTNKCCASVSIYHHGIANEPNPLVLPLDTTSKDQLYKDPKKTIALKNEYGQLVLGTIKTGETSVSEGFCYARKTYGCKYMTEIEFSCFKVAYGRHVLNLNQDMFMECTKC